MNDKTAGKPRINSAKINKKLSDFAMSTITSQWEARMTAVLDDWMRESGSRSPATSQCPAIMSGIQSHSQIPNTRHRFDLLRHYYGTALASLPDPQRQIIEMSKFDAAIRNFQQLLQHQSSSPAHVLDFEYGYSSPAIRRIMGFESVDDVEMFKNAAFRALTKELIRQYRKQKGGVQ